VPPSSTRDDTDTGPITAELSGPAIQDAFIRPPPPHRGLRPGRTFKTGTGPRPRAVTTCLSGRRPRFGYAVPMTTVVQKYGGNSVADIGKLKQVAERVMLTRNRGHDVVVVVSAMGGTTGDLLAMATQVSPSRVSPTSAAGHSHPDQ
jgi:hypothetical protein